MHYFRATKRLLEPLKQRPIASRRNPEHLTISRVPFFAGRSNPPPRFQAPQRRIDRPRAVAKASKGRTGKYLSQVVARMRFVGQHS